MGLNNPELPSQAGNSGKFLQTNGSTVSWESATGGNTLTWTLIETLNPSSVATVTSSASFSGYTFIKVICRLIGVSTNDFYNMRVNGDSASNYTYRVVAQTAVSTSAGSALALAPKGTGSYTLMEITFPRQAAASGDRIGFQVNNSMTSGSSDSVMIMGFYDFTSGTDVNNITIFTSNGTFSGTVQVYGR